MAHVSRGVPAFVTRLLTTLPTSVKGSAGSIGVGASTFRPASAQPADDGSSWLVEGVTIERPLDAVPTILGNAIEHVTGEHDERRGRAAAQLLLAGQQLVVAGLRAGARGSGIFASGSSMLSRLLPTAGIAMGAWQVVKGWNELADHHGGPFSLVHSKTARTGMIQILAGALMFVPGVGPALGGVGLRLAAAANEMDAFSSLDWPLRNIGEQAPIAARIVHPFDRTPVTDVDNTTWSAYRLRAVSR